MANRVYIKTYSPIEMSDRVFDNIADLAEKCIESGVFPYTKDIPMAPNRDIISNHKLTSVQSIELELQNALLDYPEQNWIFGANAALLGLELKKCNETEYNKNINENNNFHCSPIILYNNVKQKTKSNQLGGSNETNILKEGLCIDCQTAYSLNQFTDESIKKVFSLANVKDKLLLRSDENLTEKQRTVLAQYLIENYSANRCGETDITHQKNISANVISNLTDKNNPARNIININLKECKVDLNETEKKCFNTLWNYFLKQNGYTGGIQLKEKATDQDFLNVIKEGGSKKFVKMVFDASLFSERLCHYGFSFSPVFTELEYNKSFQNLNKNYSLPEAGKKEDYIGKKFISDRTKKKFKNKDYQYNPTVSKTYSLSNKERRSAEQGR